MNDLTNRNTRLAALLLGIGIGLCGCSKPEPEPIAEPEPQPLPVIEEHNLGVAVVDLERIYLEFPKTKAAQATVDANIAAAREVGRPLLRDMEWARSKMQNPQTDAVEAEQLKQRVGELRAKLDEMTKAAPPMDVPEEQKQEILSELSRRIGALAAERGFNLVLNRETAGKFGPVTFGLGNFPDLTEHLIKHLQQPE